MTTRPRMHDHIPPRCVLIAGAPLRVGAGVRGDA
ncbi:hypothetical protein WDL1CHR_03439 [Variovorax sp. WDL1]|nr:hypothetical protein CHC07_00610 [Variovorax sp. B4]PNG61325.1 hypothetical protein CHC06_01226 [Variovorax sp. B2]VTV12681.1 hypothetical protein WDL1CHR_03439 [Variovorax sp. WDL1]